MIDGIRCQFFLKKREEGKVYRVSPIADHNKFLKIYHPRASKILNESEISNTKQTSEIHISIAFSLFRSKTIKYFKNILNFY